MALKRLSRKKAKQLLNKGLRKCVACRKIKSLNDFYKNISRHGGYAYVCKRCQNNFHKNYRKKKYVRIAERKRAKKYREKNKDILLNKRYFKAYGISSIDKQKLLKQQKCKCKICQKSINMINGHLDHNHKNKKIRGVLCLNCNTAIGLFNDRQDLLKRALNYLS